MLTNMNSGQFVPWAQGTQRQLSSQLTDRMRHIGGACSGHDWARSGGGLRPDDDCPLMHHLPLSFPDILPKDELFAVCIMPISCKLVVLGYNLVTHLVSWVSSGQIDRRTTSNAG